ncbi:ComEC/Rec2 family competence protein [Nocardiopsis sediminis]|uniref:ComEC/Rec2 family competence protein n=1 Tax=Nocardiopsis sediminis TaxID=1778267 RepID=A0ABV8FL32_9ACTN
MLNQLGTDAVDPEPGRVPDLRLVGPAAAAWLCAGLLLGGQSRSALLVAAVVGGAAVLLLPALRLPSAEAWAAPVVAVLVCGAGAALATGGRLAGVEDSPVTGLASTGSRVSLHAVLTGDPRPRAGPLAPGQAELVIDARTSWVEAGGAREASRVPVVVLASGEEWARLLPGQGVTVAAKLVPAGDGGGLVGGLVLARGPPERIDPPPAHQAWAGHVRARLREAAAVLPAPARGLLPAMVVGDTSGLDATTREDFAATGMTHLLTVSGSNLAVLSAVALGLGRWAGWAPWATALAGAAMIAVFVLVARAEPSVLRAAFMGAIALLALALGRRRAGLSALAAAVIGLLLFDPELARSYGFALSVLATGGIMVLAPGWRDRWSERMPRWLAEAVAVAAAAHVACAPVLVLLSQEVSWVSVPANVAVGPLIPIARVGGFAVAGLALVWPAAAALLVWVPGAVVIWVGAVARFGAELPNGALPWRGDVWGAMGLAVVVVAALVLRGRARRVLSAVGGTVLVAAVAVRCVAPAWPPAGWALVACDVGQGDALALSAGDGRAVLVDTGADPGAVDRCLDDLGVEEISLLVLTHGDMDHVGGAPGVAPERAVAAALAPPGVGSHERLRVLESAGTAMHVAASGQRLRTSPWTFDVLWPHARSGAEGNDASVVLLAAWSPPEGSAAAPMRVLLTGDIEESPQRALLGSPAIRDVDVLKTPHHGAQGQEPAFLEATRPRMTLTSVGADNPFGHPAPRTWEILTGLTPANHRTDHHGDIAVIPTPDGPSAVRRGPQDR